MDVNAAISFVFPLLVEAAGATVTFALFATIRSSRSGSSRFVPETRGRTLEELEDDFRANSGKVVHRPAPAAAIHAS